MVQLSGIEKGGTHVEGSVSYWAKKEVKPARRLLVIAKNSRKIVPLGEGPVNALHLPCRSEFV